MRKILFLVGCCLGIVGCQNNIHIGNDLKIIKENNNYIISGSFSNKNKDCGIYNINFKFINGDIIFNYNSIIPVLVDEDIYEFSIKIADDKLNNISNLDAYKVDIIKIKCDD